MHWLKIVYYITLVLALAASIKCYKHRKYVLFIPLLIISLTVEILSELIEDADAKKILSLYTAVEYSLLSFIISNFINSQKKKTFIRLSILVLVPFFIFIQLVLAVRNTSYKFLDSMIEAPILCVWTILYLFETAKQDEEFEIFKNPMFWISLGNLLFFSGSFFSYGFGSYLASTGHETLANQIFWIARMLNILLYFLYFIGFICLPKKR